MSEAEMIEMMYEALGYADRNFEFWLSATFAVVLAIHFTANRLTTLLYRLIVFLYISATVLFISRWAVAAMQYGAFRRELLEANASIWISGNAMEAIVTIAYLVVIVGGTVGTVYFCRRTMKNISAGSV